MELRFAKIRKNSNYQTMNIVCPMSYFDFGLVVEDCLFLNIFCIFAMLFVSQKGDEKHFIQLICTV